MEEQNKPSFEPKLTPEEVHTVKKMMGPPPAEIPAAGDEPEKQPVEPLMPSEVVQPESDPGDSAVDSAIDDITLKESDTVIDAEDAKLAAAFSPHTQTIGGRLKDAVWQFWHNKKARYLTLAGVGIFALAVALVPQSRYAVMNTVGVRVKASVVVVDSKSLQPLKNIAVSIGGVKSLTDRNGTATLTGLKQGQQKLIVEKRAFASIEKQVTIGWGTNQLGSLNLVSTGVRYTFMTTDLLSGMPVAKIEAKYNDAQAIGDEKGVIVLTVDPGDSKELEISLSDTSQDHPYRSETVTISADTKESIKKSMVPAAPHYFISKRTGTFNLYKTDVDGANEKLVLEGTGKERDDISLTTSTNGKYIALVSTRDDQHNSDGFTLSGLFIINGSTESLKKVTQSEQIQIVGWLDNRLVYVKITDGTSTASPNRNKLMTYDPAQDSSKEIASSNYFNDVVIANNALYYAPSNAYGDNPQAFLFQVNADGSNKKTLLAKEVWNIFRSDYSTFTISTALQEWFSYTIGGSSSPKLLSSAPNQPENNLYIQNNDHALWIDDRDGQGVLLSYDTSTKKDTVLATMSGLQYPAYWLTDTYVVYRVKTPTESADYVVSTAGGSPRKIQNVADTNGIDRWYYY